MPVFALTARSRRVSFAIGASQISSGPADNQPAPNVCSLFAMNKKSKERPMATINPETTPANAKDLEETRLTAAIEQELTDDQLVQLAEGASSWGANCNKSC